MTINIILLALAGLTMLEVADNKEIFQMRNKYFIVLALLLVALAQCAFAEGSVQIIVPDDTTGYTKPVSANNPLPTTALVTVGSVTVDPAAPVSENITTIVSATAVAQSVASLANRKTVTFINQSGTVTGWASLDSAAASAAVGIGVPLPPYGFFSTELDASKIVGVAADGVASITVYQDGY
jgi:hypothetical protein